MNEKEENQEYRLTAKGILFLELGPEKADRAWAALDRYARRLLDSSEERGVPAIVLEGGGTFVALKRSIE